ncbi:DUF6053 domain-containing protein [Lysobacter enzymogenes]|uniref:DUF6053 domain-containing protein n=1 Tax=Lysobacter enzymogenes TaxID=69 RepID=UPI003D2F6892
MGGPSGPMLSCQTEETRPKSVGAEAPPTNPGLKSLPQAPGPKSLHRARVEALFLW